MPSISDGFFLPESLESPESLETPDIPESPESPESPETPETPDIPETPENIKGRHIVPPLNIGCQSSIT